MALVFLWAGHIGAVPALHLGVCVICPWQAAHTYLGLLLLCGIHNGGAAHLCQLTALAIERPAADLVPNDILDEEHAAIEAQGQLVKQFNVLQQVIIRVAEKPEAQQTWNELLAQGGCWQVLGSPLPAPIMLIRQRGRDSEPVGETGGAGPQ